MQQGRDDYDDLRDEYPFNDEFEREEPLEGSGEDEEFFDEQQLERLRAEAEADELFRRRVRKEIRRVKGGDAEDDIAQDIAFEEQQQKEREELEAKQQRREKSLFWLLISGNVLLHDYVRRGYRYLIILAVLFFLSIVTMFTSLHLDLRYGNLSVQVIILQERSLRLQSERFSKSSHSEISRQLKARNIDLHDPTKPRINVK